MDDHLIMIQAFIRQSQIPWAEQIPLWLRPSIRLHTIAGEHASKPTLGSSQIGGIPNLPPSLTWPFWQQQPLKFIAQLNCRALQPLDLVHALPNEGFLAFFYDGEYDLYDREPNDPQRWRVLYWKEEGPLLQQQALPDNSAYPYYAREVQPMLEWALPDIGSPELEMLGLTWEAMYEPSSEPSVRESGEMYLALQQQVSLLYPPRQPLHRSLGYADPVQTPIGEPGWQLLLQIDSDEQTGVKWGDMGRIYYLIAEEDLKQLRFDRVRFQAQSS